MTTPAQAAVLAEKWTETRMIDLLRARYKEDKGWAFVSHVGDTTGFDKSRTADGVAMHTWPSRKYETLGFEVKVSRSDWTRELGKPAKAESVQRYCHQWFLVVPDAAIVKPGELPLGWGLLVVRAKKDGELWRFELAEEVKAERRVAVTPKDDGFLAALLRAHLKHSPGVDELKEHFQKGHTVGYESGKQHQAGEVRRQKERNDHLTQTIHEFEEKSGINLLQWRYGDVGEAVKLLTSVDFVQAEKKLAALGETAQAIATAASQAIAAMERTRALNAEQG